MKSNIYELLSYTQLLISRLSKIFWGFKLEVSIRGVKVILPGGELKIFYLGGGELPPGLTLNRGGKMTKISSWGGKIFFSLAVLKSCPCMGVTLSSFSFNMISVG